MNWQYLCEGVVVCCLLTVLNLGCKQGQGFDEQRYKRCVLSGKKVIPEADQMDELYEDVDHFIVHYGRDVDTEWQTVAYFGNRYVLSMAVPVTLSKDFERVARVRDKPQFYLWEVREVEIYDDGRVGSTYNSDGSMEFGAETWEKIYAAEGDFQAAGKKLDPSPVPDFERYVEAWRRDRIKVP